MTSDVQHVCSVYEPETNYKSHRTLVNQGQRAGNHTESMQQTNAQFQIDQAVGFTMGLQPSFRRGRRRFYIVLTISTLFKVRIKTLSLILSRIKT